MPVKDYDDPPADAQLAHLGAFADTPGAEGAPVTLPGHPQQIEQLVQSRVVGAAAGRGRRGHLEQCEPSPNPGPRDRWRTITPPA